MNIAIDCRSIHPGKGGIGNHTEKLVKAIAQADGRNTYLLLFSHRKGPEKLVNKESFFEASFEAGMIDEPWEQMQLPTILSDHSIDLYHSPCFALPVVKNTRWQVATVHDVVFRTRPELVDDWLRDYLDRWTEHSLEVADAVITVSEFSKKEMVKAYGVPPEKVHVIYNGVDSRFRRQSSPREEAALQGQPWGRALFWYLLFRGPQFSVNALSFAGGVRVIDSQVNYVLPQSPSLTRTQPSLGNGVSPAATRQWHQVRFLA